MAADRIILEGARLYGYHGVNPEEKELGQTYIVDLVAELDLSRPSQSDQLEDTVSYTHLYRVVKAIIEGESRNLLETLAQAIADKLLADLPLEAVSVTVKKPHPPIKGSSIDYAAAQVHRLRTEA